MELVLLAIAATGVLMSIYGKYAYEKARRRLRENAVGSPSAAMSSVGVGSHYVVIDRARTTSTPPRSRRRHRPMRESE